jgi:hypothetical protein
VRNLGESAFGSAAWRAVALAGGTAICLAELPATSSYAAVTATVRELRGSGEWIVTQDYGGGAGIKFDQRFTFSLRAGHRSRLPLTGGKVAVPLRVTVRSSADGALNDFSVSPPRLQSYTCTSQATTTQRATLRLTRSRGAVRLSAIPLHSFVPGAPRCTPEETIEWPTGDDWLARGMTVRTTLTSGALFRPVAMQWPQATHDCSEPTIVGTCSEQLAWSGTLRLGRR